MKQGFYVLAVVTAVVLTTVVVANFSLANRANQWQPKANISSVRQAQSEVMSDIMAKADYTAWVELMNSRIAEMSAKITEDNFAKLVTAWQARQDGDWQTASSIHEELDMGFGPGSKMRGQMMRQNNKTGICHINSDQCGCRQQAEIIN